MKLSRFEVERFGISPSAHSSSATPASPRFFLARTKPEKTTLLAFLRELMFGFDERSHYAFNPGDEISGNATADVAERRHDRISPKKRPKKTSFLEPSDRSRSAKMILLASSAKRTRRSSRTCFAFGLGELERGQDSLAHANLQSALYAGALGGGRNIQAILKKLDAQIGDLFKARGEKQPITETAQMKELGDEMSAASLRSHDFSRAVELALERNTRVETLAVEIAKLRVDLTHTERLLAGAPLLDTRRALAAELTALGNVDARRVVAHAQEIRTLANEATRTSEDTARAEVAAAKNEGEREELERAATALDPTWDLKRVLAEAPNALAVSRLQDLARARTKLEAREESSLQTLAETERRHEAAASHATVTATPTREIVEKKRARRDLGIELLAKPEDLWVNKDRKAWLEKDRTPFAEAVKARGRGGRRGDRFADRRRIRCRGARECSRSCEPRERRARSREGQARRDA